MNSISVSGVIGKDAETKTFGINVVCNFSVSDSQGKDKPTIWWNCQLWGKRAETLSKYLTKGSHVTVIGELTEREWTNKDGISKKVYDLRVNNVALQGRPPVALKPADIEDDLNDIPF